MLACHLLVLKWESEREHKRNTGLRVSVHLGTIMGEDNGQYRSCYKDLLN